MSSERCFVIQIALCVVPVWIFVALKAKIAGTATRLAFAVVLALSAAVVAYHLAAVHGWRPIASNRRVTVFSPLSLAAINGGVLMLVLGLLTFAKKKKA